MYFNFLILRIHKYDRICQVKKMKHILLNNEDSKFKY